MTRREILNNAKDLVVEGRLKAALNLLRDNFSDSDYDTTIIMLSARINRLREQELQGIISHENARVVNAQIMHSTLSIISCMANDSEILLDTPKSITANPQQPIIQIVNGRNIVIGDINAGGDVYIRDENK